MEFARRPVFSRETALKSYGRNFGTGFRFPFRVFHIPPPGFHWNSTTPPKHQPAKPHQISLCGIVVFFSLNQKKRGEEFARMAGAGPWGRGSKAKRHNATNPAKKRVSRPKRTPQQI
jgi:hypothetical protein